MVAAAGAETDVCCLQQVDPQHSAKMGLAFSWEPQKVDRSALDQLTKEERKRQDLSGRR